MTGDVAARGRRRPDFGRLGLRGDEDVLDLGCGSGLMLLGTAARTPAGTATGIDLWRSQDQAGSSRARCLANADLLDVTERVLGGGDLPSCQDRHRHQTRPGAADRSHATRDVTPGQETPFAVSACAEVQVSAMMAGMAPARTVRYESAVAAARASYAALPPGAPVRLAKKTSNLFRMRAETDAPRLDLSACQGVFDVDEEAGLARVGGLTTYERLVDELLPHGFMPLVVPQLRTITIGGAVVGLGIEATSFRNGLPHESVLEADVLTGTGEVVTATPDGEHADLFASLANSYGTLGYTLGLVIELERTSPYVLLEHHRFTDLDELSAAIGEVMTTREHEGTPVDFMDGVVFSGQESYLTLGRWSETTEGLRPGDYTGAEPFYRSIQHRRRDVLTAEDYLWRWDTDWFWCSRAFGAQNPTARRLWPRRLLRSDVYWKIMAFEQRHGWYAAYQRSRGRPPQERVIQDVEIPLGRTADFLRWFLREVPIEPVWLCPVRLRAGADRSSADVASPWPLYPMRSGEDYVNVGFWSAVDIRPGGSPGDANRAIEAQVTALGGHKGLYSDAFYDEATFRELYGGDHLDVVKARYDPRGRLPTLYDKAVRSR